MNHLKTWRNKLSADIITIPEIFKQPYYRTLDGLRGLSVLMVIMGHLGFNYVIKHTPLFMDSSTGVHIFFVLSGFLITTLLLKEKIEQGYISLKYFYIRRILRILPVAYLFLIVLILLNIYYKLHIPAFDFIASFLFFKNLPIKNEPFTAHFWTLAVEEQFYFTFPFLLVKSPRAYFQAIVFIVIAVPVISLLGSSIFRFIHFPASIDLVIEFARYIFWKGPVMILIGSAFSILSFKNILKPAVGGRYYFLSFVLLAIAMVMQNRMFLFYRWYVSEYISAIIIGYVIVLIINGRDFLSAVLNNAVLVKTGILSYSLYIWQELFIGVRPRVPWLTWLQGYPILMVVIIKLILVFIIGFISYYAYESRFLKWKDRFR